MSIQKANACETLRGLAGAKKVCYIYSDSP